MKRIVLVSAAIALLCVGQVDARPKDVGQPASNGVLIKVFRDEFKAKVEFSAPTMPMHNGSNTFAIRHSTKDGTDQYLVDGFIRYKTPWRFYTTAMMAGGDKVAIETLRKDILKCTPFGCTVQEIYQLQLTRAQFEAALVAHGLSVQLSSAMGSEFVVTVPEAHLQAVAEFAAKG